MRKHHFYIKQMSTFAIDKINNAKINSDQERRVTVYFHTN